MITDELIKGYCEPLETRDKTFASSVASILTRLQEYEAENGIPLELFNKSIWIDVFNKYGWVQNRGSFPINKSRIVSFIRWMIQNKGNVKLVYARDALQSLAIEDVAQNTNYQVFYYSSPKEFMEMLDEILNETWLIRERTYCELCWLGLKTKDIINLKVEDINTEKSLILQRPAPARFIEDALTANRCKSYLRPSANRRGTFLKEIQFGESSYILKKGLPVKKGTGVKKEELFSGEDAKVSPSTLGKFVKTANSILKDFSESHEYYGKRIKSTCLNINALFCELYQLEDKGIIFYSYISGRKKDEEKNKILKELFEKRGIEYTQGTARYYSTLYKEWKEFFIL